MFTLAQVAGAGTGLQRCANGYSWVLVQPPMLTVMSCCAYCGRPATMRIVAFPEQVCFEHAMEFWTGLLVYARDLSEIRAIQLIAIAAAGPSPADHEHFAIRLAS